MKPTMTVSDTPTKFRAALAAGLTSGIAPGPFTAMRSKWKARYSADMRRRFNNYSRGGGDWAPLAASTMRGRRKGRKGKSRKTSILRDTGTLFGALVVGAYGNKERNVKGGIEFGFAKVSHPGGGQTVAQIASYHQRGNSKLPRRRIIVQPSPDVKRAMQRDLREAVVETWRLSK